MRWNWKRLRNQRWQIWAPFRGNGGIERRKDDLGRTIRLGGATVILAMRSGNGVSRRHLAASP